MYIRVHVELLDDCFCSWAPSYNAHTYIKAIIIGTMSR